MKNVPYSTFSDFVPKNGTVFRNRQLVRDEFEEVPNYKLTSKAFDVRHLDRFINKINTSDTASLAYTGLNRDSQQVSAQKLTY